ncbi:hypothetical protein [Eisenbergiella massiliensis]|uniref:hypothetical protein n=1 Tax=Eisenbergiella massiliensis TaxID=1720294 RepID=UPI003992CEB7
MERSFPMIDAHVHLEKGPYTREWLQEFIFYAQERGIRKIYFLEHTHIFRECSKQKSELGNKKSKDKKSQRLSGTQGSN